MNKKYYFIALDSTQSELFDVKAKFDEMAAARYHSVIFKFHYSQRNIALLKNFFEFSGIC